MDIPQVGNDLQTYAQNVTENYIVAYGIIGTVSDVDADNTYNFHTAFDVKPTKVVYNVDLDMNQKKLTNIQVGANGNDSATTLKTVKDVKSLISTSLFEEIFDQVFDINDVKSLKIVGKVSVIVIAGFVGMEFPSDKLLSDYQTGVGITLTGICSITLTKTHTLNNNFTVSCVTYYTNTTNCLFKIRQSVSSTAHFTVNNNRWPIQSNNTQGFS